MIAKDETERLRKEKETQDYQRR
jgi:CRP-like cAMP-binding protein